MYSYPSLISRQIQLFSCEMELRYREYILTHLVPFPFPRWLQNIWILVALFNCDLKNILGEISLKISFHCLPFSLLSHKTTYIQRVLRRKISQIWLFCCRFFFPMPQLTPNCERVLVLGFQPTDGTEFSPLHMAKIIQLVTEIRSSEDYCLSDIVVVDYANISPRHVTKFTPDVVKKYELCAFVSSTYIYCINKDNRV